MQQRTRNTNNTRPCPGPIGPAAPHATLIESRIVQIATQNRSTDPKKSGAKTSTAIVTQSWTYLNASAGNFRWHQPIIRDAIETFSLSLPLGLLGDVHTRDRVRDIARGVGSLVDKIQQLEVVHNLGVGDVHDVLGPHLETGGEQVTRRIAQVDMINGRHPVVGKSGGVDAELLEEVTILVPVDVNLSAVGLVVIQSAGLADRLGERQRFDVERNFGVEPEDVLIERSERGERGRFAGDEDNVIRPNENVFARIVDHAAQQYPDALAVALQRNVAFDRLEFGPSRACDQRQQAFADAVESQHARRVHVTQNAHDARVLLIEANDDLRLDRAIAQPRNDRLLYFRYGPRGGGNLAGVRNINATLLIDRLRRQIHEVTGTCARGLAGGEQSARGSFEDRDIEHIADAYDLLRLG